MLVKAGDHVEAGQNLLRVDCRAIEAEKTARASDLAASEAAFARATHGYRPEEVAVGEANVNLAEARLLEAQKQFDRTRALHEGVTVTRVQIDQAERDAHMAEAMLAEVRAKLALLKVGSREEDIAEARARRHAAKARLQEAAAQLAYCTVDAPIGGVILSTRISSGQLMSSMAPVTLITMVDDRKRSVRAFVSERDVSKVCLGEQVRIAPMVFQERTSMASLRALHRASAKVLTIPDSRCSARSSFPYPTMRRPRQLAFGFCCSFRDADRSASHN